MNERRAERALRLRCDQPGSVRYTCPAAVPSFDQRDPTHFPRGHLRCADVEEVRAVAKQVWPDPASWRRSRDRGLYKLAAFLAEHPGDTRQQRWDVSPLDDGQIAARGVGGGDAVGTEYTQGMQTLFALRIVRPTLAALRINQLTIYPQYVVPAEDDESLNRFVAAVAAALSDHFKRWALFDVCAAMTVHGVPFAGLTPKSFLHYAFETRATTPRTGLHVGKYVGHSAWQVLSAMGHFPPSAPPTLRNALRAHS